MTPDQTSLQEARQLVQNARAITVMTGAGISAESGIPTFRGADGLWNGKDVTTLASPEGFAADPRGVWAFYNERRHNLMTKRPNPGHIALSKLETQTSDFGLITQNVDRLHRAAGSQKVTELHGNIWEVRCTACGTIYDETDKALDADPRCPADGARLRPCVVWFGEALPTDAIDTATSLSQNCDVFLVIGTSGVVYPAAGFTQIAQQRGAKVIEINLEATPLSEMADLSVYGKAGEILPQIIV